MASSASSAQPVSDADPGRTRVRIKMLRPAEMCRRGAEPVSTEGPQQSAAGLTAPLDTADSELARSVGAQNPPADHVGRPCTRASESKALTKRLFATVASLSDVAARSKLGFDGSGQCVPT